MSTPHLKVFFDGFCHVCTLEMVHYSKVAAQAPVEYIDIFDPNFDPKSEGLDPVRIHQEIHVKRANGEIITGVDAFVALWTAIDKYSTLRRIIQWPIVYQVAHVGYWIFARLIRPYLPKRKTAICSLPKKPLQS